MLYFVFAAVIIAADRLVKWWVTESVTLGSTTEVIPGFLNLTHTSNSGAAFSFLSGANMRWLLVGCSMIACILLVVVIIRYPYGVAGKAAAAMVLGGAFGNLIDRALYGSVTDMFEFSFVTFAIWNIADAFIVIGALLFVASYIVSSNRDIKKRKAEKHKSDKREKLSESSRAEAELTRRVISPIVEMGRPEELRSIPQNADSPPEENSKPQVSVRDHILPPKKPVNTDLTETQILIDFEIDESLRN